MSTSVTVDSVEQREGPLKTVLSTGLNSVSVGGLNDSVGGLNDSSSGMEVDYDSFSSGASTKRKQHIKTSEQVLQKSDVLKDRTLPTHPIHPTHPTHPTSTRQGRPQRLVQRYFVQRLGRKSPGDDNDSTTCITSNTFLGDIGNVASAELHTRTEYGCVSTANTANTTTFPRISIDEKSDSSNFRDDLSDDLSFLYSRTCPTFVARLSDGRRGK